MQDERTPSVIERYLDGLQGDAPAEPLIRDLLERLADLQPGAVTPQSRAGASRS